MKKTTRILPLVFSALVLLVFVTASARARSAPNPSPPQVRDIVGQIRWKKDMGLIPIGPGSKQASPSACSAFFIFATTLSSYALMMTTDRGLVAYSQPSTKPAKEEGEYYVCNYSIQVPIDASVFIAGGIGDVGLLPRLSRQSYYWTDQWIGGTDSRPPAGARRWFSDRLVYLPPGSKPIFFRFEMVYRLGPIPNPTLDSSTPLSEEGASPLLRRASSFAGAWYGKLGEGALELILQQTGSRVTGQVNVNSANMGRILEGIVVDNTLRFQIVRAVIMPNGRALPDQYVGIGELVMNRDGKSFTGNILGTATNGTLVGR